MSPVGAVWTRLRRRFRPEAPATCAEVARTLQPFLDGEVDEHTRSLVARHLDDCRDCGLEAETYRSLKDSMRARGTPPPDALARLRDFAERITDGTLDPGVDDG